MNSIMIIDDDINIVKMISNIIKKNNLGKVVAELNNGSEAVDEIMFYNPDILLIDYLLPFKDGVEITNTIYNKGFKGKTIMISQVENKEMIAKAYNSGVLFFISKPINSIEVINVIKNVSHNVELERSLNLIKSALSTTSSSDEMVVNNRDNLDTIGEKVDDILTDLGIISDFGAKDLKNIIIKVYKHKKQYNNPYTLSEIYKEVYSDPKELKSLEQRIRRIIQKSLNNLAEIGLNDFYNLVFTDYSTLLFDFKQVKQEMEHIKDPTQEKGRINIKKFIEGILTRIWLHCVFIYRQIFICFL